LDAENEECTKLTKNFGDVKISAQIRLKEQETLWKDEREETKRRGGRDREKEREMGGEDGLGGRVAMRSTMRGFEDRWWTRYIMCVRVS
jgi:hypothetical protein